MAAAALLLIALLLTVFTPGYQTNDDTALMYVLSGASYGQPSAQVPYTNVLIAWSLKQLYQISAGIPWYGLYLYTVQAVSWTVIGYALWSVRPRLHVWILAAISFVVGPAVLVIDLQFTSTAILLGGAGILLHLALGRSERATLPMHLLAGVLLGGSALLRWHSFLAVLVCGLPLLLLVQRWERRGLFRTGVFLIGAVAILVAGATAESVHLNRNPAWKEYLDYNATRGQLHGTVALQSADRLSPALLEIGWSDVEFDMFRSWFFTDPEAYDVASLRVLVDATDELSFDREDYTSSARLIGRRFLRETLILIAGLVTIAFASRGRRAVIVALLYSGWIAGLLVWLATTNRLPDRVAVPMIFLALLGPLIINRGDPAVRSLRRIASVALALALLLVAVVSVGNQLWETSQRNEARQHEARERLRNLAARRPGIVYANWGGQLSDHHVHPLRATAPEAYEVTVIGLGWRTHSPDHRAQMKRHGIRDLPRSIADDPLVRLIAQPRQARLLERYLHERDQRPGTLREVHGLPGVSARVYDVLESN